MQHAGDLLAVPAVLIRRGEGMRGGTWCSAILFKQQTHCLWKCPEFSSRCPEFLFLRHHVAAVASLSSQTSSPGGVGTWSWAACRIHSPEQRSLSKLQQSRTTAKVGTILVLRVCTSRFGNAPVICQLDDSVQQNEVCRKLLRPASHLP